MVPQQTLISIQNPEFPPFLIFNPYSIQNQTFNIQHLLPLPCPDNPDRSLDLAGLRPVAYLTFMGV